MKLLTLLRRFVSAVQPTLVLAALCFMTSVSVAGVNPWVFRTAGTPSQRSQHAVAFDAARGRTVLFGGFDGAFKGDTWEWDGSAWELRSLTDPSPRSGHAMTYDTFRNRTVLFGGREQGSLAGETLEWDGSTWTLENQSGPSARHGHAMAYDAARRRTVLFGGSVGVPPFDNINAMGDTWEWDGSSWTQRASTGPSARSQHALAYDAARGRVVLFGGRDALAQHQGDTWEWDGSSWSLRATTGPTPRAAHAMTNGCRVILFGGVGSVRLSDTWEWGGGSWQMRASNGPTARLGHAMAYDASRERVVLFGGDDAVSRQNDTWELPSIVGCLGEASNDGRVDFVDVTAVLAAWGADYRPACDGAGEANGDGVVTFADVTAVLAHFGELCP